MSRRNLLTLIVYCLCCSMLRASGSAQPPGPRFSNGSSPVSDSLPAVADTIRNEAARSAFTSGTIHGVVSLEPSGTPVRNAVVTIAELQRSVLTDENGAFQFTDVPAGRYQVIAHLDRVPDVVKRVEISSGDQSIDFQLLLAPVREEVIVTASGSAESVNAAYQSVNSVGALELAQRNPVSIGEALEGQLGIAKRSFGPGSGRPIIRGFDGDRVLVLQDGLRLGGIASQSADEVEPIDLLSLDRVEIVRGPATLLYGSNAIGGVVNGVSANETYSRGLSGYATAFGSNNNRQSGESAGFKFGMKNFLIFGNEGVQKANDYRAAKDQVFNSYGRAVNASGGLGWFNRKGWIDFGYSYDRRRHGIPVAPDA